MSYKLVEIDQTPGGNGLSSIEKIVAVSSDKVKLEEYCKKEFKTEVGKPEKFSWDNYYLIQSLDFVIL